MATDWLKHLERPLAFVLGGGASLGAVQLGMLRAVLECGLRPDFLVALAIDGSGVYGHPHFHPPR